MADEPFDPDAYLASKQKAFDPDEYLRSKGADVPRPRPTWSELGQAARDITRRGANTLTFGQWPRVVGAIDALTSDKPYSQAVNEQVALGEEASQRLGPFMAGTVDVLGGGAGAAGLARTGATLIGRTAPWTWSRFGANIAEPATYGALHGAGSTYSENPQDYITNAQWGAGTGAALGLALPAIGSAARGVYETAADRLAGVPPAVGRAARADAAGLANLQNLGPEAMLLDAGPSMQSVAQAYVQGTGLYRSGIVNALMARDAGTTARLRADREAALGVAPRPSQIESELDTERKAINTLYQPVMKGRSINPAGVDQTLAAIDTIANQRRIDLGDVRNSLILPKSGNLPDLGPEAWLSARQRVDSMIAQARAGADRYRASNLGEVRDLIDAQLARDVPGIKAVDARFAHNQRQGEAFEQGRGLYETGKEAIHPGDIADTVATGTPQTNLRLRQGVQADLERRLGTTQRDLSTEENIIKAPWNQEKSVTVLGQPETEAINRSLARNRQFRESYQRIAQGSDTAQRQAALRENALEPIQPATGGAWERFVERPAYWLINRARAAQDETARTRIAQQLVAQAAERDAQVNRLLAHNAATAPGAVAADRYARALTQGGGAELATILNPFAPTEKKRR